MAKKKLGFAAMAALGMMGLGTVAPVTAAIPAQTTQSATNHRDATDKKAEAPKPIEQERKLRGGFGMASNKPQIDRNQRQYRKLVRQNPHIKNSRKHRSKN